MMLRHLMFLVISLVVSQTAIADAKTTATTVCAACHGADGKGNQGVGAPNLTDNIWLHGAGEAAIIKRIHEGKMNQMPAWANKFTPEQIKVLTAYVWGFSNQ